MCNNGLVSFAGSICFCIGEQKAEAFCEAVNCEQSEQEGKFPDPGFVCFLQRSVSDLGFLSCGTLSNHKVVCQCDFRQHV